MAEPVNTTCCFGRDSGFHNADIINPAPSNKIMIINIPEGRILPITELETLPQNQFDKEKALSQIMWDEKITISSHWKNILLLPPGCTYHNKTKNIRINLRNHCTDHPSLAHDPFEILVATITEAYTTYGLPKFIVRLSGGVDSTCILFAALEAVGESNVTAITWFDENSSANEDIKAATALCKKLNIKHLLFKFEPDLFFHEIVPSDHLFINIGMASEKAFEKESDFISTQINDTCIILDGHGGDHLFLDPVPSDTYKYLLKNKKIFAAAKNIAMSSKLSGLSFYETIINNRKQKADERKRQSEFFTNLVPPPSSLKSPTSLAEEHLQAVEQALCQNAVGSTLNKGLKVIYPFTNINMVKYVLNQNPHHMFDSFNTRLPLRKSFKKKHPTIRLRSDKGHITSSYQKALKHHEKYILEKINDSWLARENLINISHIKKSISHSALGLGGVDPILIKIICASLIKEY